MSFLTDDHVYAKAAEREDRERRERASRLALQKEMELEQKRRKKKDRQLLLTTQLEKSCQQRNEKEIIALLQAGAELSVESIYAYFKNNSYLTDFFIEYGRKLNFTEILINSFESMTLIVRGDDSNFEHKRINDQLLSDERLFPSEGFRINFIAILQRAVSKNNKEMAIMLFKADLEHKKGYFLNDTFWNIFLSFSKAGRVEWMLLFLEYYREFLSLRVASSSIIFEVIYNGNVRAAKILIEARAPIHQFYQSNPEYPCALDTYNGYLPLHIAAQMGNLPMIQMLIEKMQIANINLSIRTKGILFGMIRSYSASELSLRNGHQRVFQYLNNTINRIPERIPAKLVQETKKNSLNTLVSESKTKSEEKKQTSVLPKVTSTLPSFPIKIQFNYRNFLAKHSECNLYLPSSIAYYPELGTLKSENPTVWDGFVAFCKDINRCKNVLERLLVFNGELLNAPQISDIQNFCNQTTKEHKYSSPEKLETILLETLEISDNPLSPLCKLLTIDGVKQLFSTYCQNFLSMPSMYINDCCTDLLRHQADFYELMVPVPQSKTVTNIIFDTIKKCLKATILADNLEWIYSDCSGVPKKISFLENPLISIELELPPDFYEHKKYDFKVIAKTNSMHIAKSFFRSSIIKKIEKHAETSIMSQDSKENMQNLFIEGSYRCMSLMDLSDQKELENLLEQLAKLGDQPELLDYFFLDKYKKYLSEIQPPSKFMPKEEKSQTTDSLTSEEKFKNKLNLLISHQNSGKVFLLTKPKNTCLVLQFVGSQTVNTEQELKELVKLFKDSLAEQKIGEYRIGVDLKKWKVTVIGAPVVLNQISQLLNAVAKPYLAKPSKIPDTLFFSGKYGKKPSSCVTPQSEPVVSCMVQ